MSKEYPVYSTWITKPADDTCKRNSHAAVLLNNHVYLLGGMPRTEELTEFDLGYSISFV